MNTTGLCISCIYEVQLDYVSVEYMKYNRTMYLLEFKKYNRTMYLLNIMKYNWTMYQLNI